eukprot:6212581-Pleurochrysis_carterae.AAC.9
MRTTSARNGEQQARQRTGDGFWVPMQEHARNRKGCEELGDFMRGQAFCKLPRQAINNKPKAAHIDAEMTFLDTANIHAHPAESSTQHVRAVCHRLRARTCAPSSRHHAHAVLSSDAVTTWSRTPR